MEKPDLGSGINNLRKLKFKKILREGRKNNKG